MNLIAMIGTIQTIKKNEHEAKIILKVEKPFIDTIDREDFFEEIEVNLNSYVFDNDLKNMKIGTLVGFKGRIKNENNYLKIIAERVQIF